MPPDGTLITFGEPDQGGIAVISGAPGSVPGGASVWVSNLHTSQLNQPTTSANQEINMTSLNTVNVLSVSDSSTFSVTGCKSFTDDETGNDEAEALFIKWSEEAAGRKLTVEEAEQALEDGVFEIDEGFIAIVHST